MQNLDGMTEDERDFDWVEARANCDPFRLFAELSQKVQSSCSSAKRWSEKRTELSSIVFQALDSHGFSVERRNGKSRVFRLDGDHITVESRDIKNQKSETLAQATALFVNNSCLLSVKNKLHTPHEFSRIILESFFFAD